MFIKFGKEVYLSALNAKGEIYFNPCKYFRDLELEQMKKGIGDGDDGGISSIYNTAIITDQNGKVTRLENQKSSFIVKPCLNTPTFCLRKSPTPYITEEYREILRIQFPEYTHALVIEDEASFLENIRYCFRSRAFAHQIFYEHNFFVDFTDFLHKGTSDVSFYVPKSKSRYYVDVKYVLNEGGEVATRIDDSNFYKTMFRKGLFFKDQFEYRIVLPYQKIEDGCLFPIAPVAKGYICEIDALIR